MPLLASCTIALVAAWASAVVWAGVPPATLLRWIAAMASVVVLPAHAIVRRIFPRLAAVEWFAVAIPLGVAGVSVGAWVMGLFGAERALPWIAAALGCVGLLETILAWRHLARCDERSAALSTVIVPTMAVLLGVLIVGGFLRPIISQTDGSILYRDVPIDVRFHVVLTSEVARTIPPMAPYLAGVPLNYHYLIDVFAMEMQRLSGAPLFPLIAALQMPFFLGALVVSLTCFVARLTGSIRTSAVALTLVFFVGGAFNAVVGPLMLPAWSVWEHIFHGQSALALFTMNPQTLGLAMLFGALLAYGESRRANSRWGEVLAGVLLGATCAFKMFLGLLALGGLATALIAGGWGYRRREGGWLFLSACVSAGLAAGYFLLLNAGSGDLRPTLRPGWFVLFALEYLRLSRLHDFASAVYHGVNVSLGGLATGALLLVILTIGNLGYRLLVLPVLARTALDIDAALERRMFAFMFWAGLFIFLGIELIPVDWPAWYNNAGWFHHVGLTVAAITAAECFVSAWDRRHYRVVAIAVVLYVGGALSMVQFFVATEHAAYTRIDAGDVTALNFVRDQTPTNAVILVNANPYLGGYPNVEMLAERRVFLGADWAQVSARKADLDRRVSAVTSFFRDPVQGAALLDEGVDYVWANNTSDQPVILAAGGAGACDRHGSEARLSRLTCVFVNERVTVYRVSRDAR